MKQYTPMMQQYLKVKENYKDALVFYRLGDFYEMFFEDAKIAAYELDLVLTGRNAGQDEKVPMCGVPYHAVNSYLQRLVNKGYKIAIVEQLENPEDAVGIVKRDVVRVITPGTVLDDLADEKDSVYLASLVEYAYGYALAFCEMSTGEAIVKTIDKDIMLLKQTLFTYNVKELVLSSDADPKIVEAISSLNMIMISYCDEQSILERYQPLTKRLNREYYYAAYGLLLNYLLQTQKRDLGHLRIVEVDNQQRYLSLDYATVTNLEIVQTIRQNGQNQSLYQFLDKTQTAMGSRMLRQWVTKPLVDDVEILQRQEAVAYFVDNGVKRAELKKELKAVYDLQRLLTKVTYGTCNGIDCQRILKTLKATPNILNVIHKMPGFDDIKSIDQLDDLRQLLETALEEEPPTNIKEGNIFKVGYHAELDRLREMSQKGTDLILALEQQERERTGIKNLKIGYNRVFGYYFEVSKGNLGLIKPEFQFIRKQTLVNAERFITETLKQYEEEILNAKQQALDLELRLYQQLITTITSYLPQLQQLATALATIDCLGALAEVSAQPGYTKPIFNQQHQIDIKDGRHPVLETLLINRQYVVNDLIMPPETCVMMITGPNMGGKSTFMRQCALIVIMAQMGCYVPASHCQMPIFDKVFTRMGASDDILSGQSTFMVEMMEANTALSQATENSLILFDEIGRGTSTYDGMSLAQAMVEYIASKIKAKTLFSTHYHELTELENEISAMVNYHVEVHEEDDHVTFLYRVLKGKANRSYGINVAKLAKLPNQVIQRAKTILDTMQQEGHHQMTAPAVAVVEIPPAQQKTIETLSQIDVNTLTPLQALQLIADLQELLKESSWTK